MDIKKKIQAIRNNEELSIGAILALRSIEDEFDRLLRVLAEHKIDASALPIPGVSVRYYVCSNSNCKSKFQTKIYEPNLIKCYCGKFYEEVDVEIYNAR